MHAAVALVGVLGQAAPYGLVQTWRRTRTYRRKAIRLLIQNGPQHAELGLAIEGAPPSHHLIEHTTKTENIGSRIRFRALQNFGRHVLERTHHSSLLGQR